MINGDLSGRVLGDFVLHELLCEGGHGAVYRAEQPLLERDVVVKVLRNRQRQNPVSQERFLREAQLASQLDHPYAAHIYASGVESTDGVLWLAMERVQGVTLHEWLAQRGPMSLEQFVPLFDCIAQVVHAAHQRGIVHRDLKPSNVMIVERDGILIPKLLDFGIAKAESGMPRSPELGGDTAPKDALERARTKTARLSKRRAAHRTPTETPALELPGPQLTQPGSVIGSAAYMSPEQWRDPWSVGPATDIYALGVMAFKTLTGSEPFVAGATEDYYQLHHYAPVPSLCGEFSRDVDRVLQRALAKRPQERHGSALAMAAQLRAALRSSEPERLRAASELWEDRGRAVTSLWDREALADLERWIQRGASGALSPRDCSFLLASYGRAKRRLWLRRVLSAVTVIAVFGMFQYRSAMRALMAERETEVTLTQSALEQGRAALLHGEPEASMHLAEAYRRAPSPSTAFMFARALQPRLAEQARFQSTSGRMWSARFSPDGNQIVTSDDKSAQVWDAQTYRLLSTMPHDDTVYEAVYSADGTKLITGGGDGVLKVWNAATGTLARALKHEGTKQRYYGVAVSPDGKLVAALGQGLGTHVWALDGDSPPRVLADDATDTRSLAFSANGRWLATIGNSRVRVYDTRSWAQVQILDRLAATSMSWDPHGPHLLTGNAEGAVVIWALPSGKMIHRLRDVGEQVDAVAFSPDGRLVVAASRDGAEQVWDAKSGKLRSQGNFLRGKILSVEFDQRSELVVSAGVSGSVAVSDASLGMLVTVLDGPRNVVRTARFDPRSRRIVGASWDGTARVWDATAPYRRWGSAPVADSCGYLPSLEPDRRFIAVGCIDYPTRVWDTTQGKLIAELPSVTQVEGDFSSAFPAVSADGRRAAIARNGTVELYELPSARLLRTISHGAAVNAVAFASAGHDLVSGAVDGSLLVTRGNGALLTLPHLSGGIDATGFLPDGRVVATDVNRRLVVYSVAGDAVAEFQMASRARTLRPSSDGRRLVTVPNVMRKPEPPELWDVEHYRSIARLAAQGRVYSARFVSGHQVATASADAAARLWDGDSGQLLRVYRGGSRFMVDVTLSSDGTVIVAGGGDGVLRFWDVATERLLWAMAAHRSHIVGVRIDGNDVVTRGFSGDISRWTLPPSEQVIAACGHQERCAIVAP